MASLPAAEAADAGVLWLATLQRALARASHDVKDALNGVSVNLEVIRSRAARPGAETAVVAPFAEAAAQQLERLTTLLEAVLALGRAEREPANVGVVLRRLATLCSASSSSESVVEVVDGGEDSAITSVRGDVVRLALAGPLLELVAPSDGTRSAAAAAVRCTLSSDRDAIVVTVRAAERGRRGGMPEALAEVVRAGGVRWSNGGTGGEGKGEGGDFSLVFPRA